MTLDNLNILITGGSRGLGLGLVEAMVRGARVTVVARGADALEAVQRLGVETIAADVTDATAARRILSRDAPGRTGAQRWRKPPMGDWTSDLG